jgi:hypothetical protein
MALFLTLWHKNSGYPLSDVLRSANSLANKICMLVGTLMWMASLCRVVLQAMCLALGNYVVNGNEMALIERGQC